MTPPEFRRRPSPAPPPPPVGVVDRRRDGVAGGGSASRRDEPTAPPIPLPDAYPAPRLRNEPNSPPGPYPSPRPREEPTAEEIAAARLTYDSHVPSMFARQCLAPGCGEWPCRPYREAVAVLRAAGVIVWT